MKIKVLTVLALGVLILSVTTMAKATPMDLNYVFDSSPAYANGYSFGSVSIFDNSSDPNRVDLNVTLTNMGWKILGVYLNYNDAVLDGYTGKILTTKGKTVGISDNNEKAGGYSAGKFDLQDPASGNLNYYGTYNDTLYAQTTSKVITGYQQKVVGYQQKIVGYEQMIVSNTKRGKPVYGDDLTKPIYGNDTKNPIYGNDTTKPIYGYVTNNNALNLDALDFYKKDTSDSFYAVVHIGNYGNGEDSCNSSDSIWVAAGDAPHQPVPEPSTLLLLGGGLAGLAFWRRKRS